MVRIVCVDIVALILISLYVVFLLIGSAQMADSFAQRLFGLLSIEYRSDKPSYFRLRSQVARALPV
jgi:hypothetical protein